MSGGAEKYYKNKVVWITGASSGIGEALALRLSSIGTDLILSGRNRDALERIREVSGKEHYILPFDLEDPEQMETIGSEALSAYGRIDSLINNGGQGCRSAALETSLDTDWKIMRINYLGNIALAKAILPHFLEKGSGQYIVISSLAGKFGTKSRSAYAASKHALHGFYESLRAETHREGVRITIACPGFISTSLLKRSWDGNGTPMNLEYGSNKRMSADECARQILEAGAAEKEEVVIGRTLKERIAVDVKRFFPNYFSNQMKKADVS